MLRLLPGLVVGMIAVLPCAAPAAAQDEAAAGWEAVVISVPKPVRAHRPAPSNIVTGTIEDDRAEPPPRRASPPPARHASGSHSGIASFYWQGTRTASGEPFDRRALTAAHPRLRFGTRVRVTNLSNGRSVVVRINDRGPFKPGRIIDLSEGAAEVIGMKTAGLANVRVDVLESTQR